MSLKPQYSFSSGELDPILHDRVTLERFQNALDTARNTMIGKTGTLISRFSRFQFKKARFDDGPIRLYCPPNAGLLLEIGYDPDTVNDDFIPGFFQADNYVRIYDFGGNLLYETDIGVDTAPLFGIEDLEHLHFETVKDRVYIFGGKVTLSNYAVTVIPLQSPWTVLNNGEYFEIPTTTVLDTFEDGSVGGTGYDIEYAWTVMYDGQETIETIMSATPVFKKPINVGELNQFTVTVGDDPTQIDSFNEVRIYQRPKEGSAFGFLGRAAKVFVDGGLIKATFKDIGADPDYYNSLQTLVTLDGLSNIPSFPSNQFLTGIMYQQRLLLGNAAFIATGGIVAGSNPEAIVASRPAYQNNFYRDNPYSANSALNFKAGSSGRADVLRMIDNDGLIVFTKMGIYANVGILSPDNTVLARRGKWVIDVDIPPLVIAGGLFFVDKTTSSVRQLSYSQEAGEYDALDQSVFSNHLFKERTIKSWCYQDGVVPLIIVTFSDGKFATYTYSNEHQLKAWTRHDAIYPTEQVEGTGLADTSFFVINKNGTRYIEGTVPRYAPSSVISTNPEYKMIAYGAFMDSLTVKVEALNDNLLTGEELILIPVVSGEWEGQLTLTCGTSALFANTADNGAAGSVFRFFHPKLKYKIDLTVLTFTNTNTLIVQPSEEFPVLNAEGFRLYKTHDTVTGLDYLEGEEVSVMCDGGVVSSPYNDNEEDDISQLSVIGGELELPIRSAITVVGRPICADVQTLNVSTVEQSPTVIESMTPNKVYIRISDTKGLFIANMFPEALTNDEEGTSVKGMESLDTNLVPDGSDIIANRAKPGQSRRIEKTLGGSWNTQGKVAMRQVDPLHFEILSIILDLEILKRSDR